MAFNIDLTRHEMQITITADSRRGIWASSLFQGGKAVRFGGKLPTEASAHTGAAPLAETNS
jgi:hypothetical protein